MSKQFIQSKLFNFIVYLKFWELKLESKYSKKHMNTVRNRKIKKLIRSALKHELYQKKFKEAGLNPDMISNEEDLKLLPVLTKSEYRDMINAALEDSENKKKYRYSHKDHTSGSTGIPLHTCLTPVEYATVVAQRLYLLNKNGYRLFRDSSMDMSSPVHKGTRRAKSLLQRFGLLKKYYVSTMDSPQTIINAINESKPTEITAGKSIMHSVLQYASDNNLEIYPVKFISNTAEPMDDSSAALIEKFFGSDALIDCYASIEAGIIANTMCGNRHKFHLNQSHYIYSIKSTDGETADNGELFITNLFLHQFPMINYKQGDYVESIVDKSGTRYITKVKGRNDDYILTKDGKQFSFHSLFAFLPKCSFIEQYRVIQEDYDNLRLLLVMRKSNKVDKNIVEKDFTEKLNLYLQGAEMTYHFEWIDEIPIDKNGKIRVLISNL